VDEEGEEEEEEEAEESPVPFCELSQYPVAPVNSTYLIWVRLTTFDRIQSMVSPLNTRFTLSLLWSALHSALQTAL